MLYVLLPSFPLKFCYDVYASFFSVNVLIFIGSTAGRCLISLKDSVQREEEKRLLQLLLFSVSQASTTIHRQLKNTEAFTVNLRVVSPKDTHTKLF